MTPRSTRTEPHPDTAPGGHTALTAAWPAALLAVVLVAPFLGKAFTIDDTVFLFEARHALVDPLHPTAFEMTWSHVPERVSAIVPTGPVMAWLLVPAIAAGGSEVVAHLVQLGLLLVAALATASLALRVGLSLSGARLAGLVLVSTPAVLGMAGTAMPDVPAMALGVAGVERLVAFRDDQKLRDGILAASLLGLAPMARTHLLLLLPIALLLAVEVPLSLSSWRRIPRRVLAVLAGAAGLTVAIALSTRDPAPGGGSLAGAAASLSSTEYLPLNLLSLPGHWVLAMGFGVGWAAIRARELARRGWVFLAGCLAGVSLVSLSSDTDAAFWMVPVFGLGVAVLADALLATLALRRGPDVALAAWLLLPLPAVVYSHFPPKYLLASAPAAALLLARAASAHRLGTAILAVVVAGGSLLGVAILRADAAFAEVGRTGVALLARPAIAAGHTVWYDGHWGFQWYAEKAGARCWTAVPPQPRPGDLIISSARRSLPLEEDVYAALVHLRRYEDRRPGGRVLSRSSGAGFYSNLWGHLPWAWGTDIIDAVDLWQAPGGRR